ncbi:MAG: PEGA domain-containing protein [Myxococcota bacterium]|nr:PEGA domain-containing protein [Myxococcota bacterium]MEC8381610.1 PEGA domain-containing protein [Myxococcota bacterium]
MPKAPINIVFLITLFLWSSGCAHRMRIETIPSGASVSLNNVEIGESPLDINTIWWPLRSLMVKVNLPGYRTQIVDVGSPLKPRHILGEFLGFRFRRLLGLNVRKQHKIILVRKHKQAGTWLPDDAYRMYR